MNRVTEKVKDIVEIRPFTQLNDFTADPALTLSSYHFTDITADLMAKWIDRVADIKPGHGAALALAGFRGVGKSHFLAVVAAIVSQPELRARIADQHVASSADRLARRHNRVALVRRGSGHSLLEELKRAVAEILSVGTETLSDSLHDLLLKASEGAGELPLVLLIDTSPIRDSRVTRDDGMLLSEIAEAAKTLGIFVGLALDDDISGADGANSSIVRNFAIDYLDHEHLYKIVDTHIFSKYDKMLPVLHDIYDSYRTLLPGFRWSEQRFSSLYPLHPATLEIAPLIRLYIHDFALLGFAADAGVKILGRPANSLIGLDEVFDGVEIKLRHVSDLQEAFVAFDKLEHDVVAKAAVQFRLPAKLVLKGLLMLSLNGQGVTPSEIAASMMIFNESASGQAALDIGKLLDSFAENLPNSVVKIESGNQEPKYCFKLTAKDGVNDVLAKAVKTVPDDVIWGILHRHTAEKFSDIDTSIEFGALPTNCTAEWRGAVRRGQIVWNRVEDTNNTADQKIPFDWKVFVERGNGGISTSEDQLIVWRLAELTKEESDTIRRYHLLHENIEVRELLGESVTTALHVHSIAVEKIWQRIFLQDAVLIAGGAEYQFDEEARSFHSLAQLFTRMLAAVFETQYPFHPEFSTLLDTNQVSVLMANFFSGAGPNNADAQKLAEVYAFPLGLAVKQGDNYAPANVEALLDLVVVNAAFDGLETDADTVVSLEEISSRLQASPFGLTRESQHLILAALVAQRQFEFVTTNGNRINHRSLDLQIIWDDIVGLAEPPNKSYSPKRLLSWAKIITGNAEIRSLDRSEDRLTVIDLLSEWLAVWREDRVLDKFDALPDENLNAAIWKTAANLQKSFGTMAENIDSLVKNEMTLDQCLQSIGELFTDSEDEFEKKKNDLMVLGNFTAGVSRREEITKYLALSETTDDVEIEGSRQLLLDLIHADHFAPASSNADKIEKAWISFKGLYSEHFAERHDAVLNSLTPGQALKEFLSSAPWAAFERLSVMPGFGRSHVSKAKTLIREIRQLHCDSNIRETLESKPFCGRAFRLSDTGRLIDLPNQLQIVVGNALESFRVRLAEDGKKISGALDGISTDKEGFLQMSSQEIRLLKQAADRVFTVHAGSRNTNMPAVDDFSDILPDEAHDWEHDVARPPKLEEQATVNLQ